ncbi:DUF106 domain-containing protein [Candidatus Woesearchaeota archaeon]|jgi:uncharacterized membrane protein (DUF106 family)|nr:DUF106 domain-containing protein [Candidatus Woesearchaeota archaeon]
MVFENLLDPVFAPLLNINSLVSVIILAFIISILITLVYKYVTDQNKMKEMKDTMKKNQKKMKELKNDPDKMMKVQKETMQINMEMMKQSFKPTIITLLPIIIIFGWLNANLALMPIQPGEQFDINLVLEKDVSGDILTVVPSGVTIVGSDIVTINNQTAKFSYSGQAGDYLIEYRLGERVYTKELRINENRYAPQSKKVEDGTVKAIVTEQSKKIVLNLFGWKLGWLGVYIIFSLIFSLGSRKLLKVH